jgi:SPP1 gp7 family putative phage head morphogenesis protein
MWGAHQVDGRIAAKNATKIRAALRQSVDAKQIYEQYQRTQPNVSDNVTQDRARARAWSLMNILFNNEALRAALLRLYAEAWVTGDAAAGEAIGEERALRKAVEGAIDWSKWQPGDAAAAMLLDPPKAFEELITSSGSLIRGLDKTGYELIGTALADSIRAGYSPNRAAKLIQDAVGSPARALTIAVTESSRVMNASALARYREAGIQNAQWMVVFGGGACDKCAQNANKVIPLGGTYPSGNTQPPAHPHCRCNLRPVVPDYADTPSENGITDIMTPPEKQYGGIPESKIRAVRDKATQTMDNPVRGRGADDLAAAYEEMNYNGLPRVLDADDFDALAETADAKVYRGLRDTRGKTANSRITAEDLINEYKQGEHYAGYGVYGNGTYTTNTYKTALDYAGDEAKGIMEILIPDTSNFINQLDLKTKITEVQAEINAARDAAKAKLVANAKKLKLTIEELEETAEYLEFEMLSDDLRDMAITISDPGTAATLFGYDGFYISEMSGGALRDEIYYIVLNRAKVVVKK